ncbi:transcriptional regulator GlcC [Shigella flexneri]|uniref:transcriptional regulator GlcC n=4 Tax=Gammaproteobacteria TaxID=1236 RepID=UPI00046FF4CF|nr:transcriptional regulator GlcC [Shigella flexneri]
MKDERRPICEVVAESIERLIIDGVLKVGQPLPSERRLCEKLGFSRSALREGLTVLRGRGIIETAQGRDSHVARLNREQDTSPLIHLFSTQPRTLYDLLDVRALLEGESARLAATLGTLGTLGTQADFVVITRCYEKMLAASENHKEISLIEHAQLDHAFHLAICQASHNQVLVFTLQSLTDLMFNSVFASVNNLYHRPQQKKQIDRQHARIYNAVLQRLPHVAQRAARSARSCTDREKESPRYRAGRPPFDSLGGAAGDEQGGNVSRVLPYPQGEGTAPALNRIWC